MATGPAPVALQASVYQRRGWPINVHVAGVYEPRPGAWDHVATSCPLDKVLAFDGNGAVPTERLRKALERPVVAFVSADGKSIDPCYTRGQPREKLFLIIPGWSKPKGTGVIKPGSPWQ